MKVIVDDNVNKEIIEYLKTQKGIIDVKLNEIDVFIEIDVSHNDEVTPSIIFKYIELFLDNKFSNLIAFDKETNIKTRYIEYEAGDMCCEYCYMGFVKEAFENNKIISFKSNYDIYESVLDIKFEIEYDESYKEEDLIKFIKEHI